MQLKHIFWVWQYFMLPVSVGFMLLLSIYYKTNKQVDLIGCSIKHEGV